MKILKVLLILNLLVFKGFSQEIPSGEIIPVINLSDFLIDPVKEKLSKDGDISPEALAKYFREKFSERYYYDWKTFDSRFSSYNLKYPEQEKYHRERAEDHIGKFADSTNWVLPFNYLNDLPVDAYAIRHLARQHKMVDVAFQYHYSGNNSLYLDYFRNQLNSLNNAFENGTYEKIEDGNGIYEVFRSGYRVLNWLWIHNMILADNNYTDEEQLQTIATLLQHGAHLYENNKEFTPGNHQTRGMSALAMLSILFRDFKGTEHWYERSMKLLGQHLEDEINVDGFQFERSVHYHIRDIGNYYYVYRLAQISEIPLDETWNKSMGSLFSTLLKIAYPDKSAPVLQDDTDNPWAEKNDISQTMTLGYLLFKDPEMGFFAEDNVEARMYWFLNEDQLNMLGEIKAEKPKIKSVDFPETGYYVMREGWDKSDKMMIVSAGLDSKKPDHQHGDMLGVQAMANNKVVLPNYQVRYSLKDLEMFKNSMVKNVALVDDELQGKEYTSNQGGSGFGKFRVLPKPKTITWQTNDNIDLFVGSHDGFENVGVDYTRQVIYVKDDFWIIKDNFNSEKPHAYKQVWQGHYTYENAPKLLRGSFDNGSGLDIFQLNEIDEITGSGQRGKEWSIALKEGEKKFSFLTVLLPYSRYSNRINELDFSLPLADWRINSSNWDAEGSEVVSLSNAQQSIFFSVKKLSNADIILEFSEPTDVYIKLDDKKLIIQSLSPKNSELKLMGLPNCRSNSKKNSKIITMESGDIFECLISKQP
jgi:hypothetical protein